MHTLNTLIDQAVDQAPVFRRLGYRWLLKNKGLRAAFSASLIEKMADEPFCAEVVHSASKAEFTGDTTLALNPDNLKAILDFIMKLLPLILQLFVHA